MTEPPVVIELNPREQRLYDRLRARVATREAGARSGVADLVLLLPDLTVLLVRLLGDERVPLGSKLVAVLGLGYVVSPLDLIPEIFLGPLGLLDDLLIVGAALSRLLADVHPDVVRSHWSGRGDALAAIQRVASWSDGIVRTRVRAALRRLLGAGGRS